jgi:pyruvate carboxylase
LHRQRELEAQYSRNIPRHLVVIEDMFPGDVEALLNYQKTNGVLVQELPLQTKLRGMAVGEELNLSVQGKSIQLKMLTITASDQNGIRTVFMEVQNRLVRFPVVDTTVSSRLGSGNVSAKIITAPKTGQLVSPMPAQVVELKVKAGDSVKKGDVLLVLEAMKMRMSIVADKDGIVSLETSEKSTVKKDQLLAIIG